MLFSLVSFHYSLYNQQIRILCFLKKLLKNPDFGEYTQRKHMYLLFSPSVPPIIILVGPLAECLAKIYLSHRSSFTCHPLERLSMITSVASSLEISLSQKVTQKSMMRSLT